MTETVLQRSGTAVVVIDVQNDYCHPDGVFAKAGLTVTNLPELVERTNVLVQAARRAGRPVIWVRMEWADRADVGLLADRSPFLREEGLRTGTWGANPVDGLDVSPADAVVTKKRFSSFYGTDLDRVLAQAGVNALVVAGVRTDFCIESTVRDAFFRDLDVVIARDAVAGFFPDLHDASLRVMSTVFARVQDVDEISGRSPAGVA